MKSANVCFLANVPAGQARQTYYLYLSDRSLPDEGAEGIRRLQPELKDGYRRLDTGAYTIELCAGTAGGD